MIPARRGIVKCMVKKQHILAWEEPVKPTRKPIGIGIPCEKYISQTFWPSFFKMQRLDTDVVITVGMARTDRARNMVVEQFLGKPGLSHLLFLDSDMVFPPDTIPRLLYHQKMVVGCLYFHRDKPYQPHAYTWSKDSFTPTGEPNCDPITIDKDTKALIKIDAIGTGGLLVAREIFEQIIKPPWFEYGGQWETEDITFCRKLQKAGVNVYVDTACEAGHEGTIIIGRDTYLLYNRMQSGEVKI